MDTRNSALQNALTGHARRRMQQRGIPLLVVQLIEQFGCRMHQNKGIEMYLDKRSRQKIAGHLGHALYAHLEKHMNAYLIECDGYIVTVGHKTSRVRKY